MSFEDIPEDKNESYSCPEEFCVGSVAKDSASGHWQCDTCDWSSCDDNEQLIDELRQEVTDLNRMLGEDFDDFECPECNHVFVYGKKTKPTLAQRQAIEIDDLKANGVKNDLLERYAAILVASDQPCTSETAAFEKVLAHYMDSEELADFKEKTLTGDL